MPLLNRKPTPRQTRLAEMAIKRILMNAPLTPEMIAYVGYPKSSLSCWRTVYLNLTFLQELCRLAPRKFKLSAANDVRFVKQRMLRVRRGRRPKRWLK